MIHHLKTWPEYYADMDSGAKTFEVRKDDRGFMEGDLLILQEYLPHEKRYTGHKSRHTVLKVYRNVPGLIRGYCVMQTRKED